MLAAVFCGVWVVKTLRFQKMTWLAWTLLITGTGLNALMKPYSNAGVLYGLRVIPAIGAGFLFQLPVFAVQATTIDDDLGIATATVTFFRSVGQAFGVAIGGTVFQNQFNLFLDQAVAAGAYGTIRRFPELCKLHMGISTPTPCVLFGITTSIGGAGLIVSLVVWNESMDRGNNAKQAFRVETKEKKLGVV